MLMNAYTGIDNSQTNIHTEYVKLEYTRWYDINILTGVYFVHLIVPI